MAATDHVGETLAELPGLADALASSGGTLLEIGSGYGVRVRRLIDAGALRRFDRIVLSDVSPLRVERARTYVPEATAIVADAEHLPVADHSVDFVLSDQVIEHVPSDAGMAAEIRRVLRPGGLAFVGSVVKAPWAWYFYRNGGRWVLDPTHVREYASADAYRAIFSGSGLSVLNTWQMPMEFPAGELLLRLLVLARLVPTQRYYDVHAGSTFLRGLSRLRIPIPGYHGCWVLARQ
jgi:SAM-dependent methyltransferase